MYIETDRCVIRNMTAADVDAFMAYRNNECWMRYQGFKGLTRQQYLDALLATPVETDGYQLAIANKGNDCLLGDLYLKATPDAYEIGYTIDPSYARQGLAFEVVQAMVDWLKQNKHTTVRAAISPENEASLGLVHKLGFAYMGQNPDGDMVFQSRTAAI